MERELVGNRIKELRESKNLNQTELAKLIGKTQATINKYEKGEVVIPSDILFLLSKYLESSTNYILCGEEPIKNKKAIETIAAHMEGKNPTVEELKEITNYIDFVFRDAFKDK